MNKIRPYLCSAFALWALYFILTRIPRSFTMVIYDPTVFSEWHLRQGNWIERLLACGLFFGFWLVFYLSIRRILWRRNVDWTMQFLLGHIGLGVALNLITVYFFGPLLTPIITKILLWFPVALSLALMLVQNQLRFTISPQRSLSVRFAWLKKHPYLTAILLIFLCKLSFVFFYLATIKPQASWDEANFWWPAVEHLHSYGFHDYLTRYNNRGYDPAYPLVSTWLLSIFPGGSALAAGASNVLVLVFTVTLLVMCIEFCAVRSKLPTRGIFLLLLFYGGLVFTQGGWIYVLALKVGNGDAPATLLVCLLGLSIFFLPSEKVEASLISWHQRFSLLGVGVLVGTMKPPITKLIVPSFLLLALVAFVIRKFSDRNRTLSLQKIAYLGVGAIAASLAWKLVRAKYQIEPYFSYSLGQMFEFGLSDTNRRIFPLLWTDYRVAFALFLAFGGLALSKRRKWALLPSFLLAIAMILAILWLYFSIWKSIEHESAGRYASQFLVSWVLIFLVVEHRYLVACYRFVARKFFHRLRQRFSERRGLKI